MAELMGVFGAAVSFAAALLGGGWLCIVIGERLEQAAVEETMVEFFLKQ